MDLAIYMIYAPSQVLKLKRFSMRWPMDAHAWVLIWELKGCNEEIFESISFKVLTLGYDSNFEITSVTKKEKKRRLYKFL